MRVAGEMIRDNVPFVVQYWLAGPQEVWDHLTETPVFVQVKQNSFLNSGRNIRTNP
jgi:hypothetical protein